MSTQGGETHDLLVETAERLFASEGIAAVSMRRINQEAGQKNTSALHYHFGSKDALIAAIIRYRMSAVNRRRLAMLADLEASGRSGEMSAIVSAIVYPLAEFLDEAGASNNYIQFLSQAYSDPVIRRRHLSPGGLDEAYQKCFDHILLIRKDIPERILRLRLVIVTGALVHILSDFDKWQRLSRGSGMSIQTAGFISNVVDFIIGAISAPASAATLKMLEDQDLGMPAGCRLEDAGHG